MKTVSDINAMPPNQLLSWFLIGSFVYYKLSNCRVMEDPTFDHLVKRLKEHWGEVDHYHKHLVTESHLDATTGYDIDYPKIVQYSAYQYLKENSL